MLKLTHPSSHAFLSPFPLPALKKPSGREEGTLRDSEYADSCPRRPGAASSREGELAPRLAGTPREAQEALCFPLLAKHRITRASRVTRSGTVLGQPWRADPLSISPPERKKTEVIWVIPLPQHQPCPEGQPQALSNQPPCWDVRSFWQSFT